MYEIYLKQKTPPRVSALLREGKPMAGLKVMELTTGFLVES